MILYSGRQFMKQIGLDLFFTEQNIKWYESQMPFHPIDYFKDEQAIYAPPSRLDLSATMLLYRRPAVWFPAIVPTSPTEILGPSESNN